jgi:hypothetical protein
MFEDNRRRIRARIWTDWQIATGNCLAEGLVQTVRVRNIDDGDRLDITIRASGNATKGWDEYLALP